jgi:hypothetical protein
MYDIKQPVDATREYAKLRARAFMQALALGNSSGIAANEDGNVQEILDFLSRELSEQVAKGNRSFAGYDFDKIEDIPPYVWQLMQLALLPALEAFEETIRFAQQLIEGRDFHCHDGDDGDGQFAETVISVSEMYRIVDLIVRMLPSCGNCDSCRRREAEEQAEGGAA